jgi:hypothetical protein
VIARLSVFEHAEDESFLTSIYGWAPVSVAAMTHPARRPTPRSSTSVAACQASTLPLLHAKEFRSQRSIRPIDPSLQPPSVLHVIQAVPLTNGMVFGRFIDHNQDA